VVTDIWIAETNAEKQTPKIKDECKLAGTRN